MNNKGQMKFIWGVGGGLFSFILIVSCLIGMICWPYTLNTWLTFFSKPATVVWWQGAILGVIPFFGQLSIPAAIITWVLMLFI